MWRNCGADTDYLAFALLPWEWITGGYFSMLFVGLFMGITYIKYHKVMYPMLVGTLFLPIALALFPALFQSWAFILFWLGCAAALIFIILKATKEY